MNPSPRYSHRRAVALALSASILLAACGSSLSDEELVASNGAFSTESTGVQDPATDAPLGDGVPTTTPDGDAQQPVGRSQGTTTDAGTGVVSSPDAGSSDESAAPAPAAGGDGCANTGGGEIVLGTFGTEGGVIGANVATAPVGIRAWVADVNARGGLCGHPVRVVFGGNDNGDPAAAQSIARKLIEQDKVVAFLSPYSPTGMPPVYGILERAGVPVIADTSQVDAGDKSPMSFTPASSLAGNGFGFGAAFATQSPNRKVAVISLSEVASAATSVKNIRDTASVYGYEIVYEAKVSIASPDFTAQMSEAKSRGADVVVGVVDFTTMTKIIKSAKRQNYSPQFSGSLAFVSESTSSAAAEFEGVTAYSPTATYTTPQLAEFRNAVAAYVPRGELGLLGPIAWAGGKILEKIAPALDADPTSAEIIEALYTVQNEDLGGIVPPFSFTKSSGSPYLNLCVQPTRYVGGTWTVPLGADKFECRP